MTESTRLQQFEVPIEGMDCAECVATVEGALRKLPGVGTVNVYLATEKAVLLADPTLATPESIRVAVAGAGYRVGGSTQETVSPSQDRMAALQGFTRPVLTLFGLVFGAVLFIAVIGEWLGLFEALTERIPWYVGLAVVLAGGYPIFLKVGRAALRGQVLAHTLMTLGVIAALAVGEWITAAVVVFFMRVGDYAERYTTERARRAVKNLAELAPQTARVERGGEEVTVPVEDLRTGEVVIVRPGEQIPVDGEVIAGLATVDQAAITGESAPIEAGPGALVYASTIATLGSLRIRTTAIGAETTFGRMIRLVEEAEANRAEVQQVADRFSGYYLPFVVLIAALTLILRRDPLATAAVLVVACSCSFALATPIAMLASIGAAARRGVLIKGGRHLEALAKADVLLVDKTGTLTLGKPQIVDVVPLDGASPDRLLQLAAAVEHDSEHPLAEAVRAAALERNLSPLPVEAFTAQPGLGVSAQVQGQAVTVGSARLLGGSALEQAAEHERRGQTLLYVLEDGRAIGFLSAADTLRPEVAQAIEDVRRLGISQIELLTGDNERTAAAVAGPLGIAYRANLLPEDKIARVRELQAQGKTVVMVGDGVNDAPALAQADVGIAMGAAGSDVAIEAAHVALMREDWTLVPGVLAIARRTLRVVKGNIGFTAVYNLAGLTLAALGFLPPILAAAAQSLPDLGILANSTRLIKQK